MALTLLWDASGLTKRYVPKTGSEVAAALFKDVPAAQMLTTFLGYAETQAVLVRKRNRSIINEMAYLTAASSLQDEVIDNDDFGVLDVDASAILAGIDLVRKHNLNASDAAILITFRATQNWRRSDPLVSLSVQISDLYALRRRRIANDQSRNSLHREGCRFACLTMIT